MARKVQGKPWGSLAREMVNIGKDEAEADQMAWAMWFEHCCPKTYAKLKDEEDCMVELYEQSSGKFVNKEDEGDEEEETPKE